MTEQVEPVVVAEAETAVENPVVESSAVENPVAESSSVENTADAVAEEISGESASVAEPEAVDSEPSSIEPAVSEVAGSSDDTTISEVSGNEVSGDEGSGSEDTDLIDDDDPEGRVVKLLSVGQKVLGKVKRITDFGAFVDIGVGRDGLIHVSELSVRRIGKVTDVLQESQEVDVWIKKLDRDRNRISLTLIEPGTKTIRDLEKDELVNGTVTRILPYGAFVDIGIGRDALLHIREMSTGYVARPEDVVAVGDEIEARVIELSRRRQRVDLSIKGLRAEPEVEAPPEDETTTAGGAEAEAEPVDEFADVEVLSPMELAFKRAMAAEGIELKTEKQRRKGKRGRGIQDEIIARTLGVNN